MMMSLHGSQSPQCILAFDLDREISLPAPPPLLSAPLHPPGKDGSSVAPMEGVWPCPAIPAGPRPGTDPRSLPWS